MQQPETQMNQKPKRLLYATYLGMIGNALDTELFRNLYITWPDGSVQDATADGQDSCAFFVSSILTLIGQHSGTHGTVASTEQDIVTHNWQTVEDLAALVPGDVLIWQTMEAEPGRPQEHIGFYGGNDAEGKAFAVSTSWTERKVVAHSPDYDGTRSIVRAYRNPAWDVAELEAVVAAGLYHVIRTA